MSYEVNVKYYFKGNCPICGAGFDEREFDTLEELDEEIRIYNNTGDYLCWDCEEERRLREKKNESNS